MRVARTRAVDQTAVSILGIDASLTSTGLCYRVGGQVVSERVKTDSRRGADRLYFIRSAVRRVLRLAAPTHVVLEGYALGAGKHRQNNNVFNIGELGGVLLLELWEQGLPVLVVPPTTLKMVIDGKGNADKSAMVAAAEKLSGVQFGTDDEADACGLMLMGEALFFSIGDPRVVKQAMKHRSKTDYRAGRAVLRCNRLQK